MFAVMLAVTLVMVVIFVLVVMFTRMFVPPEMLAVVVMLVLFLFFGNLGLPVFIQDLLLALPFLTPVAVAPGVCVAPLIALVPRMHPLPFCEIPSARTQLLRDARMVLQETFEIRMLRHDGSSVKASGPNRLTGLMERPLSLTTRTHGSHLMMRLRHTVQAVLTASAGCLPTMMRTSV